MEKIKIINNGEYQHEFNIYKSDVDTNKHVNNIRYFHWLIDSLPYEILDKYILKSISAKFYSDAKYGEKIQTYIEHEKEKNSFFHTMKSNLDNRLPAASYTRLYFEKLQCLIKSPKASRMR